MEIRFFDMFAGNVVSVPVISALERKIKELNIRNGIME